MIICSIAAERAFLMETQRLENQFLTRPNSLLVLTSKMAG